MKARFYFQIAALMLSAFCALSPLPSAHAAKGLRSVSKSDLRKRMLEVIGGRVRRAKEHTYWNAGYRGLVVGRTSVRFRINRAGYVTAMQVTLSSGRKKVDKAAKDAVLLAAPFPYVPGWIEMNLEMEG